MKTELEARLRAIETRLAPVLPRIVEAAWTEAVAAGLRTPLPGEFINKINAPALALLDRGGKRWRPLVLDQVYSLCTPQEDPKILDLAALVELPHNGSLIIDDIEDKAEERRGGPAIHLMFGTDMAINTGNFLYFLPTYLLDSPDWDPRVKALILHYYLRTMRRLHFGQGLDIQWHNDHDFLPEEGAYLQMCRFKTGALSGLSAEVGAAAAGAEVKTIEILGEIWEDIGVGFQIMDDVQNLTTGNPGKRRGDDLIEGKKSLPVILHCRKSTKHKTELMDRFRKISVTGNKTTDQEISQAIGLMEASGALQEAAAKAEDLLAQAWSRMQALFPGNPKLALLDEMVRGFVKTLKTV